MGLIAKIFGDPNEKIVRTLEPIVSEINQLEKKFEVMTEQELKEFTLELKTRIGADKPGVTFADDHVVKKIDEILPEAFAAIREAAKRVIGKRHYDVQLLGGIVLHRGQIAEMKTGEGKTLVATLPLYLNALTGWGVQLVTVNDYLSRVGAGWMAPVYHALGLSTGVIIHDQALVYDPEYIDDFC
ncbi:MAG: Protein translocase subunit SecA [Candidatus Falkowbacteria bacterium GW2011_GWF2_39_8]|uniref:Protein translocase subunit SecA n=1 Tax=Candidatus Falkowbacteria bacterium GW2011_GWF2_39_8 TaxID=1618642 RepID=A0A0G0PVJ9_9BACT|nr:MAG: Protein translocase subunit SecA [Candidatus Falkowbacteria bacterium GW2011_GWF2_39_8]